MHDAGAFATDRCQHASAPCGRLMVFRPLFVRHLQGEYTARAKLSPEVTRILDGGNDAEHGRQLLNGGGDSVSATATDEDTSRMQTVEAVGRKASSPWLRHLKKWQSSDDQNTKLAAGPHSKVRIRDEWRRRLAVEESSSNDQYGLKAYVVAGLPAASLQNAFSHWPTGLAAVLDYSDPVADPCYPRASDQALYDSFIPWLELYLCYKVCPPGSSMFVVDSCRPMQT